jgi:acyl-CoA reductase-like NAD-dependent aldehyde dehydrogenase/nicotinamidase-related amidase
VNPVLLLVDLQNDFLPSAGLQPAAPALVARAAALLEGFRSRFLPVVHVWTTVRPDEDRRMSHWKRAGKWACVQGSAGHEPPPPLRPRPDELVLHKSFFSAFENSRLKQSLQSFQCNALVVAGVHLHGCIRATVLDAYQQGYPGWVAEDAVGSNDAVHAAITGRYLGERAARFAPVGDLLRYLNAGNDLINGRLEKTLVHRSPRASSRVLWEVPIAGPRETSAAVRVAQGAWPAWRDFAPKDRAGVLARFAELLTANGDELAIQMAQEVGKPVTQGLAEVRRSADLVNDACNRARDVLELRTAADACFRYRPLGVVAVVSPWNNPLAIPLGKIAPALVYGNVVVWKPAPAGTGVAWHILKLLQAAGCPEGTVGIVSGDHRTAQHLAGEAGIDAVTLSGSAAAGLVLQEICARRHIPFQAELGGNNAAIVWDEADVGDATERIAEAAFGFAGQRCTANRRVIVPAGSSDRFLTCLEQATASLKWGDPLCRGTQVGPLISAQKRDEVEAVVARSVPSAQAIRVPHAGQADREYLAGIGSYYPPTIIYGTAPEMEVVQEETFGPVLVVQTANSFEHALALCNGVRQGLVAALFSRSLALQNQFLQEARAGILKLNRATADADVRTPFGGWKASGIGPPEHGPADREFYTRTQAVYHRLQ